MSSTYYNEYESDYEQYDEIDQTYEPQSPYMTYDEEMTAFEDSENSIFEDDYTDDAYDINDY